MESEEKFEVKYIRKDSCDIVRIVTFSHKEDAQLFWETIFYLPKIYAVPLTPRPT